MPNAVDAMRSREKSPEIDVPFWLRLIAPGGSGESRLVGAAVARPRLESEIKQ